MPWVFWTNECCAPTTTCGSPDRCECEHPVTTCRWGLTTPEHKTRYQLHYGLTPVGPHRRISDQLIQAVDEKCGRCDGTGLLSWKGQGRWNRCPDCAGDTEDCDTCGGCGEACTADIGWWQPCPDCLAWGYFPLPNSPALKAVRAAVARQFPEGIVAGADDVGPNAFAQLLRRGAGIIENLSNGTMIVGGSRLDR